MNSMWQSVWMADQVRDSFNSMHTGKRGSSGLLYWNCQQVLLWFIWITFMTYTFGQFQVAHRADWFIILGVVFAQLKVECYQNHCSSYLFRRQFIGRKGAAWSRKVVRVAYWLDFWWLCLPLLVFEFLLSNEICPERILPVTSSMIEWWNGRKLLS